MSEINIVEYKPAYQPDFERLNRHWIEKYFWMEPIDVAVLQQPHEHILTKGGCIFMAEFDDLIIGTVALKYVDPATFELTKMAVDEKYQGLKAGKKLAVAALDWCKKKGVEKIILYSNTKLPTAILLYRALGFKEIPLDGPYKRSNIKMQLDLH